jgi:hypothetical protein
MPIDPAQLKAFPYLLVEGGDRFGSALDLLEGEGGQPWWHLVVDLGDGRFGVIQFGALGPLARGKGADFLWQPLGELVGAGIPEAVLVDRTAMGMQGAKDLAYESEGQVVVVTDGGACIGVVYVGSRGVLPGQVGDFRQLLGAWEKASKFGGPSPEPSERPRRLQARVSEVAGDDLVPLERGLRAGAEHQLDVCIGPRVAGWIGAPEIFPEDQLPPDQKVYELQVLFYEVHHVPPQAGTIWLPKGEGTSTTCAFRFRARPDVPDFEGRLEVLYNNHTLQTMLLTASVLADPAAAPEGAQIAFRPDVPVRAGPAGLDPAQPRGPAILADTPAGAPPHMAAVAGNRVALCSLEGVDRTIKAIRSRLEQIASAPEAFAALDSAATVKLLRFLARQGRLLYDAIAETYLAGFPLADDLPIQLVSARESFLPLEFLYDRPAPAPDATLCPGAAAALASGRCTACAGYTEDEARRYVCPLGFWCMRRVIERHAVRPVDESYLHGADYVLATDPTEGRNALSVLRSAVCAASNKVKPADVEALRASLAAATQGHVAYVQDWAAWRQAVQAGDPSLLVLLPHTLRDEGDVPTLEIGEDEYLGEVDIDVLDVRADVATTPVVLLLGCETAVPDIPFQDFAARFRALGAAIVLNTLAPVLGRHVVPVAQMLVEEFESAGEAGSTFGTALLDVRRRGLAAGLPVVLSLVAYGDADWGIRR